LLQPGHSLRFASLPPGEHPDSVIRNSGNAAFAGTLRSARRMAAMLWEVEVGAQPLDTAERRADLERRLVEDIELIPNKAIQRQYRAYLINFKFREATWGSKAERKQPIRKPGDPWFVEHRVRLPRSPARMQREILFRILLRCPTLIGEVAEELAELKIPEVELDKLRREILEVEALRPGLDASALRQHLLLNGFAATVDALLSPSVDSGFLVRSSDSRTARDEWAHVIGMLMGGHRSALAEASNHLIDDASAANWERFLAARERVLREVRPDDDPV
jgi:DNA primase